MTHRNSYRKLLRNHIYIKLEETLKDIILDNKIRQKVKDNIYKLFEDMS